MAEQELRLLSTLVLLLGVGLFLALPFVLSIGSVVFLPLTCFLPGACPTHSLQCSR